MCAKRREAKRYKRGECYYKWAATPGEGCVAEVATEFGDSAATPYYQPRRCSHALLPATVCVPTWHLGVSVWVAITSSVWRSYKTHNINGHEPPKDFSQSLISHSVFRPAPHISPLTFRFPQIPQSFSQSPVFRHSNSLRWRVHVACERFFIIRTWSVNKLCHA